ncbi:MAG: hypothetical protein M3495_00120 [Pseudomonadota bacterium]|nr:hypothetical protein [Gammaproteobacteria bacterium]MDQ3580118.1 hypothetical protein [Pseudomonadota bacterium]
MRTDWIDLREVLGRNECRIPKAMRDPTHYGIGYCGSLAALYGDANVDPRSGGVIGYPQFGEMLELSQRQTRRVLHGRLGVCVLWYLDVPASHVNTVSEIRRLHTLAVSEAHRQVRMGGAFAKWDVSGGAVW